MNVTRLGRFLRKVRIDKQQKLKDMAEELGVSVAQLSAIELGKRSINNNVRQNIIASYSEFCHSETELDKWIDVSQPSYKEDFQDASESQRDLFISFARSYRKIPENKMHDLLGEMNELGLKDETKAKNFGEQS